MSGYDLHLNMLVVRGEFPQFSVFRRERDPNEKGDPLLGVFAYDLPESLEDLDARKSYLVSLRQINGFAEFKTFSLAKIDLTRRVLLSALSAKCAEVCQPDQFRVPENPFVRAIDFSMAKHTEGEEVVTLQPYYLGATKQFGFLVDFHFYLQEGIPFSRRIQQLSLSLDENYRRNLDYYADRLGKIRAWVGRYHNKLFPLQLSGAAEPLFVDSGLLTLPAHQLRPKTYIFAKGRESRSQFIGVKDSGPLETVEGSLPLLFIFREADRPAARRLARALKGVDSQLSFIGFEKLFHLPMSISGEPVVLADFSRGEMERALKLITEQEVRHVPVFVMPKDEEAYVTHKAVFTHAGVPTQVCTTETINDTYTLKWSVANIALQLFCKTGGKPWKVKPTEDSSLIIGISQSHKIIGEGNERRIEKYFAFSVLTDSSGLFQSLNVIGKGDEETDYLAQLRTNLAALLREQATRFNKVVLHTSFKLKRNEMDVIENVVRSAAGQTNQHKFAVVKVNQRNRFFAVNRAVNSLVPYEASYVRLGAREYLIWFEGVFRDNPNVKKALPGPTHLEFIKVSEEPLIGDTQVLQDLVNLSGANWRGFNAKSAPVSVFYCHLVAELLSQFQERNLPLPPVEEFRPWFL